ncbi:transposase [Leptolyngbya sp. CCNP1308]|uniref:IS110 family transposase n=1 Tax=Leptolyngbya sp. CCNP1308 TaxID=3110255 RepID=UPI002B20051B|nr:transposase [Leptolyngbya sp. CCNP1308]MEA5447956.1 transposase [Leptolyngbya sp. CCNP1308]
MDISKGVATCVMLESVPENLVNFARSKEFVYWHIKPCTEDLEAIAQLQPELIAFEPSGGKYEAAFKNFFRQRELPFRQVAGRRLATYRAEAQLTKDDHFDALAIAAYALEKRQERDAFIPDTPPEIENLRQHWLQRHSLMKQRTGMINRLRQNLAAEFPEAMEFTAVWDWGQQGSSTLIDWLTGDRADKHTQKWENRYSGGKRRVKGKTVEQPPSCGTGLSPYTKMIARQLREAEAAIAELEGAIAVIMAKPEYQPYIEAMDKIGFSISIKAIWLSRIYPFDKFLDEGRERTSQRMSNKGKWRTHNHSLAQFKAALGAAIDIPRSGTSGGIAPTRRRSRGKIKTEDKKKPIGCKFCRVVFWQWAMVRIETKNACNEVAIVLQGKRDEWKAAGKNLFQRSGLLHGYAAKLLYRELKRQLM